jgi:DnaJ-class molecular chaperone
MGDEADRIINDGLAYDERRPCPACGGSGWQVITEGMASDAGVLQMAGREIPCYHCQGTGEE